MQNLIGIMFLILALTGCDNQTFQMLTQPNHAQIDYPVQQADPLQISAQNGDVEAQKKMGDRYFNMHNDREFVNWYAKAAEQGDVDAQIEVGDMYSGKAFMKSTGTPDSVPVDGAEAAKWYRKAAEQGNSRAQISLGEIYENGFGVPKNNKEAVYWYHKALDNGNMDAKIKLAKFESVFVYAKIASPAVPGALVCDTFDKVTMLVYLYERAMERSMQDRFLGAEKQRLLHGDAMPTPNPKNYGCILVPPNTSMKWEGEWQPAVVTVKQANGKLFKGVTNPAMINITNPAMINIGK